LKDCIACFPSAQISKRAVTLVMHGLNVKPEAMGALVRWLNDMGSDVYLVRLAGHGRADVRKVTTAVWQQEVRDGYEAAKAASLQHAVPLYFLGYSLGALLAQSMIGLQADKTPFQKQILFSPAIGLHRRSYLIRHLFFLGERFMLPSFTPLSYKANHWLPLSVYRILYEEEKKIRLSGLAGLNFPTLVFMDPKDELISYKSLKTLLQQSRLSHWQLVPLRSNLTGRKVSYHHLILDRQTMGRANWDMVTGTMEKFLFE
jgi:esterase/lipase